MAGVFRSCPFPSTPAASWSTSTSTSLRRSPAAPRSRAARTASAGAPRWRHGGLRIGCDDSLTPALRPPSTVTPREGPTATGEPLIESASRRARRCPRGRRASREWAGWAARDPALPKGAEGFEGVGGMGGSGSGAAGRASAMRLASWRSRSGPQSGRGGRSPQRRRRRHRPRGGGCAWKRTRPENPLPLPAPGRVLFLEFRSTVYIMFPHFPLTHTHTFLPDGDGGFWRRFQILRHLPSPPLVHSYTPTPRAPCTCFRIAGFGAPTQA